ncbi:MAG: hypothetical protein V4687_00875 [Bacteroidota bacterium]
MSNSEWNHNLWKEKFDELPIHADTNAAWNDMQSLLDNHLPLNPNPNPIAVKSLAAKVLTGLTYFLAAILITTLIVYLMKDKPETKHENKPKAHNLKDSVIAPERSADSLKRDSLVKDLLLPKSSDLQPSPNINNVDDQERPKASNAKETVQTAPVQSTPLQPIPIPPIPAQSAPAQSKSTQPPVTKSTTAQPSVAKSKTTQPPVTKSTLTQPTVAQSTITQPPVAKSTTTQPPVTKSTNTKQSVTKSTLEPLNTNLLSQITQGQKIVAVPPLPQLSGDTSTGKQPLIDAKIQAANQVKESRKRTRETRQKNKEAEPKKEKTAKPRKEKEAKPRKEKAAKPKKEKAAKPRKEKAAKEPLGDKFSYGLSAGINAHKNATLYFGVFAEQKLSQKLSITAALQYHTPRTLSGSYSHPSYSRPDSLPSFQFTDSRKVSTIELPIKAAYKLTEKLRLSAGPVISFSGTASSPQLGKIAKPSDTLRNGSKLLAELKNTTVSKVNYGIRAGLSLQLKNIDLEVNYQLLSPYQLKNNLGNNQVKYNAFQMGISYRFK